MFFFHSTNQHTTPISGRFQYHHLNIWSILPCSARKAACVNCQVARFSCLPTHKRSHYLWSHVHAIAQDKLCNGSEICSGSVQWKSTMEMKCDLSGSRRGWRSKRWWIKTKSVKHLLQFLLLVQKPLRWYYFELTRTVKKYILWVQEVGQGGTGCCCTVHCVHHQRASLRLVVNSNTLKTPDHTLTWPLPQHSDTCVVCSDFSSHSD